MTAGKTPTARLRAGASRLAILLNGWLPRVWSKIFTLAISGAFDGFGRRSVVKPPFEVNRADLVTVGARTVIGARSKFLLVTGKAAGEPRIVLGDRVAVGAFCFFSAASRIDIGDGTMISRGVYISDHSHSYDSADAFIRDQGIDEPKAVRIGAGAWVGEHSVIMPGTIIGDGCVIGANAVVSGRLAPYSMVLGNPARTLRSWRPADDSTQP